MLKVFNKFLKATKRRIVIGGALALVGTAMSVQSKKQSATTHHRRGNPYLFGLNK